MATGESSGEPGNLPEDTVALVGCPNVGKSVVFNQLADTYVDVSNYPGTTIETTLAKFDGYNLTDTPGVHGISSFSEEEEVARDIVLDAEKVVNVVDATNLDRDLFLTLQLIDMGIPVVVALNMMDEAESEGIDIDVDALEEELGVPVVPTVATEGEGIDELKETIEEAGTRENTPVEDWFDEVPDGIDIGRARKTLLLESDESTIEEVGDEGEGIIDGEEFGYRDEIYSERRERVNEVTEEAVSKEEGENRWKERISDLMIQPLTGVPIALGILGTIYFLIGDLVAQRLVDFLETEVFINAYNPFVRSAVGSLIPPDGFTGAVSFILLNSNLGLLTVTVQYIFGVLLPLVVAFYLAIGVLEDSGVLPRIAVLTDRGLSKIGLNGRAVIPMIVGVGCVTMAVITTRMVGSRRERLIATALLGLAIPCSAQLGVIMGMLGGLGVGWWFAYVGILVTVMGVAGAAIDTVIPGEAEGFITELPRLRTPRPSNVLRKTVDRVRMFLSEAVPLFAVTAAGISILDLTGFLEMIERGLEPLVSLVGMPAGFGEVLILGIIRRDFAAAGMTDLAVSPAQTFIGLVVITLFVPCILSMTMIVKERNLKAGLLMWTGSWAVAFTVGGILAGVLL
ncbi:MAG: ferrous iron transport protein B [Candidatus Nanohaloarchaea archaeon]